MKKRFKKSSFSDDGLGMCVFVDIRGDRVDVRMKNTYKSRIISCTHPEWDAFIKGVKNGEFDV